MVVYVDSLAGEVLFHLVIFEIPLLPELGDPLLLECPSVEVDDE